MVKVVLHPYASIEFNVFPLPAWKKEVPLQPTFPQAAWLYFPVNALPAHHFLIALAVNLPLLII